MKIILLKYKKSRKSTEITWKLHVFFNKKLYAGAGEGGGVQTSPLI